MFLSMTGFGRASRVFPWGTVTFELTSVNHRYQELSVRLPKELSSLEASVTASLRASLKRGKIRLSAEIDWAGEYKTAKLDAEALRSYYGQVREAFGLTDSPSLADLAPFLALPGVCDAPRVEWQDGEKGGEGREGRENWEFLTAATVEALVEMKKYEGAKLEAVVRRDLQEFKGLIRSLSERWKEASCEALEALRTRIEKVMERFGLEIDPNRVAQEVSLLADKWDVSEELARLTSHVSKFREIGSGPESEGRKLDFLIQEMNREVNTMGSKVNDAEFRWMIVDAKSCLERIREQIQNVE
ncbi:MAG: YicC family protein [Synergistaceae bacterium]|nr:YicC family protein [Synergistaceae bacterium]